MDSAELCGDVTGEPYAFEVECDLPRGHEGDHHAVVTWPQRRWAEPGEQTAMGAMMQKTWASVLDRQLRSALVVGSQTATPPPTGI